MSEITNIFGKKMQIRFSKEYLHQSGKYDAGSEKNFEMQTNNIIDTAKKLALDTNAMMEKIELYILMYCLGKTEYGKKGLDYINENLPSNIKPLSEAEISYNNLKQIFKDFETEIGIDNFKDFCALYQPEKETDSLEIKIARMAIKLEKVTAVIAKTVIDSGSKDKFASVRAKIKEIRSIKDRYKQTNKLEMTPEFQNLYNKLTTIYEKEELSSSQQEELDSYLEDSIQNSNDRISLLKSIYNFSSNISKKNNRGK